MNRERRRQAESMGVRVLRATEVCDRCGMPICPSCGQETLQCECCSEPNCPDCVAYVEWPAEVPGLIRI